MPLLHPTQNLFVTTPQINMDAWAKRAEEVTRERKEKKQQSDMEQHGAAPMDTAAQLLRKAPVKSGNLCGSRPRTASCARTRWMTACQR